MSNGGGISELARKTWGPPSWYSIRGVLKSGKSEVIVWDYFYDAQMAARVFGLLFRK